MYNSHVVSRRHYFTVLLRLLGLTFVLSPLLQRSLNLRGEDLDVLVRAEHSTVSAFCPEVSFCLSGCSLLQASRMEAEGSANLTAGSVRTLAFFLHCWEVFTMSDSIPCAHLLSLKKW